MQNKKKNKTYIKKGDKLVKEKPQRTCMGCNVKKDKNEFIRIVKNKENKISIEKEGKQEGRGAYLCKDIKCLEKVIKSKRLEKALDTKISDEIYKNLRGVILDK
jgi:hypothetical protein